MLTLTCGIKKEGKNAKEVLVQYKRHDYIFFLTVES